MRRFILAAAPVVVAVVLMVPGASLYYESGAGKGCTGCHEMQPVYDQWHASSHRGVGCEKCHGGALTLDASFHWNNATRVYSHLRGDLPERIAFGNRYAQAMTAQCQECHRQEYAAWQSGPHSATYERIFLDKKYNADNMLMDDCLRCHGMHFDGGIRDLVNPVSRGGPWSLVMPELAEPAFDAMRDLSRSPSGRPPDAEDRGRRPETGAGAGNLAAVPGIVRPPHATIRSACGITDAGDEGRRPRGEDEP